MVYTYWLILSKEIERYCWGDKVNQPWSHSGSSWTRQRHACASTWLLVLWWAVAVVPSRLHLCKWLHGQICSRPHTLSTKEKGVTDDSYPLNSLGKCNLLFPLSPQLIYHLLWDEHRWWVLSLSLPHLSSPVSSTGSNL